MATVKKVRWTYKGVTTEVWAVKYVDESGKRRQRVPKSGLKKDADALRLAIEREIGDGTHTVRSQTVTVAEGFDLWLRDCERRRRIKDMTGATLVTRQKSARQVIGKIGGIKLSDLTSLRIEALANEFSERYAPTTLRNSMSALRLMLKHVVRQKLLTRTPMEIGSVKMPRNIQQRAVIPTKEDLRKILEVLASHRYREHAHAHRNRAIIVMLAMFGGLRAGEIMGLQWENVDLVGRVINIRHSYSGFDGLKEPKTKAGLRTVPLAPPLVELLERYRDFLGGEPTGFIVKTRKGKPIAPANINVSAGYWTLLCRDAGLLKENGKTPKYHFHHLRHAAVSLWFEAGLNPMHVKNMVGHESISTTIDIYGHLFPGDERSREAVNAAAAQFTIPSISSLHDGPMREKRKELGQVTEIAH